MDDSYGNNKILKKSHKVLITALTLILSLIVIFITYYLITNSADSTYINMLYKQKLVIDSANSEASNALKNIDQLDVKNTEELSSILSTLSKSESSIQNAISELNQISPPQKHRSQFDAFRQGVALNKKIYTQTSLILKNTKSQNLKSATDNLGEYITETYQYYEHSKLGKAYILLPSDILALSDKVYQYAFRAYNDYEAKAQLLEQYDAYYTSMDKVINGFQNVKTDLNDNLQLIREGKLTLEDVYVLIENKTSELDTISKNYSSLGVPVKAAEQHNKFNSILKSYSYYCQDFKAALEKFEEAGSNEIKLLESSVEFDNLNNEYKNINDTFNVYMDKYDETKSFYTDPNNL